jgi:hypothetical protein
MQQQRPFQIFLALLLVGGLVVVVDALDGGPVSNANLAHATVASTAPNVLIVVTDGQSVRTMAREVMPKTLHYFAQQNRRYVNFFVTDPLCCPSRSTIMTGRYNHNNGVTRNAG